MSVQFKHTESEVTATQLTKETAPEIINQLAQEATALLLNYFKVTTTTDGFEIVFRYKTDAVDSTLTMGDYLVRLNAGQYVVRSEEQFTKEYAAV